MRLSRTRQQARRGMAALEVVFVTALAVPMAAFIVAALVLMTRRFFGMLATGVGWPYL